MSRNATATIGRLKPGPDIEIGGVCVRLNDGSYVEADYLPRDIEAGVVRADLPNGTVAFVSVRDTDGQTLSPCGDPIELTFVPEPGSTVLLLAGAIVLAVLKRGKQWPTNT